MDIKKPVVQLTGQNGNAYNILGRCRKAMKDAGWPPEKIQQVTDDMTSGDYDHLLQVAMRELEVH